MLSLSIVLLLAAPASSEETKIFETYRDRAARLIGEALADSAAWDRLAYFTDHHPLRFSGTPELEVAIDWVLEEMRKDGLQNVRKEKVMVPRWVRGNESVVMSSPARHKLTMLGLGGSVGTPPKGITAEVVPVSSFDELSELGTSVRGKIVLYNVPFTTYGATVRYRTQGAINAARAGAVASMVRSVGPDSWDTPHTGGTGYFPGVPQIPHCAITIEGSEMIQRMHDRGEKVVVTIKMEAKMLDDVESGNCVAEIVGREKPEEIIVLGGHIDSWDVGTGTLDDGGGSVACWEAVRIIHKLGLKPRRTIRCVLWTNEENGLRGGRGYRAEHDAEIENHVIAIEADSGIFKPKGFGYTGPEEGMAMIQNIASLLKGIQSNQITKGGGGADIGPLMAEGVPGMGFRVESDDYFLWHHTPADSIRLIDPMDMSLCVATLAVMTYVLADMEERIPFGKQRDR